MGIKEQDNWESSEGPGCSPDPDAAEHYVSEEKPDAEISITDGHIEVETSTEARVSVSVWQEGMQSEEVDLKKEKEGNFSAEQHLLKKVCTL